MRYTLPSAKNLLFAVGLAATAILHAPFAIAEDADGGATSAVAPTAPAAPTAAQKKQRRRQELRPLPGMAWPIGILLNFTREMPRATDICTLCSAK